jgi:hypothetical protein
VTNVYSTTSSDTSPIEGKCLSLLHTCAHTVGMNDIDGELFVKGRTPARDAAIFDLSLGCEVLRLSPTIVTF